MGIQPIDLQTMYSQLSNVSKTFESHQQTKLTEAMQQQNNIQQHLEKTKKVQQTSNEHGNTNKINQDGSNSTSYNMNQQKNKKQNKDEEIEVQEIHYKSDSSYLGTIIDITR